MGVKEPDRVLPVLRWSTVVVGAGGIFGQLILLRELLVTFYGNELTVGVVLSNWLAAEASGAAWGGKLKRRAQALSVYSTGLLLYAFSLPLSIYLSRGSRTLFYDLLPGEAAPAGAVFLTTLVIVTPAAFTHGALYPLGCRFLENTGKRKKAAGHIYLWETIGTLCGGALFTLVLAERLLPISIALGVSFLHLTAYVVLATFSYMHIRWLWIKGACWITLGLIAVLLPSLARVLHETTMARQWLGHELVEYKNSPYGNIVVTRRHGEYTFFYDGRPVLSLPIPDTALIEDFTTLAASAHPAPRRVMILGGGLGGLVDGFLAHPVEEVVCAELDPRFPEVVAHYTSPIIERELTDPRTRIVRLDGRRYLAHAEYDFDLIVLGFLEPDTLQANRLFTGEFFTLAKHRLASDGILIVPLPGSPVYLGEELASLNRSVYHTLGNIFHHVVGIPGEYNLFFASKTQLDLSPGLFSERLKERDLTGKLATQAYLEYRLNPTRIEWMREILHQEIEEPNRDFYPRTFFYALTYWGRAFSPGVERFLTALGHIGLFPFVLITLIPAGLAFTLRKKKNMEKKFIPWAIGTSGVCGMAFDFLLLLVLQALYGFVYQMTGIVIAAFMGGAFAGGWWAMHRVDMSKEAVIFTRLEVMICTLLPALGSMAIVLQYFHLRIPDLLLGGILSTFALLSGSTIGAQFPLACSLYFQKEGDEHLKAGRLYAADLAGGWIGGMALAFFVFPLFGLWGSIAFLLMLKLGSLGAILCFFRRLSNTDGSPKWE